MRPVVPLLVALPLFAGPRGKPAPALHASGRAPAHAPARASVAPPPARVHLAPPLPMLPSLGRVRLEAARDRVLVIEEVTLPRGDWRAGGLDLYAAFGAPGTPLAVDARLVPLAAGQTESRLEDAGEPVTVEPAVRHTPSSRLLLGRPSMAGVVVRIRDAQLRAAFAASDTLALRVRSLLAAPAADGVGAREVVVRLGIDGGLPLTLSRVQVASSEAAPWITRAEARLCGPDADAFPLSVALLPRPGGAPAGSPPTLAPALATRHASDDLCVRYWAAP